MADLSRPVRGGQGHKARPRNTSVGQWRLNWRVIASPPKPVASVSPFGTSRIAVSRKLRLANDSSFYHCPVEAGTISARRGACVASCWEIGHGALPTTPRASFRINLHSAPAYDVCQIQCRAWIRRPDVRKKQVTVGGWGEIRSLTAEKGSSGPIRMAPALHTSQIGDFRPTSVSFCRASPSSTASKGLSSIVS